jgi:two-component system cell cycle response regulator
MRWRRREAFDKMTKRYYPMLVTDWEMPEMDGVALCKAVRNMQLDGYVYALLLTARDAKEHIIAGLEAGADDYLVKPVHEPELIARLNAGRRILNLEHSLRAANQRNRILSITDALTGAYNRRYLMEQLPRELERCRRYAYPLVGAHVRRRSFQADQRRQGPCGRRRCAAAVRGAHAEARSAATAIGWRATAARNS